MTTIEIRHKSLQSAKELANQINDDGFRQALKAKKDTYERILVTSGKYSHKNINNDKVYKFKTKTVNITVSEKYTAFDFITSTETGDSRIAYTFETKDNINKPQVWANFFWEPGHDAELRGGVGEEGTIHKLYPLMKPPNSKLPSSKKILNSLINALNRKEIY